MKQEIQDALRKQSKVRTKPAKPIDRKVQSAAGKATTTESGQKASAKPAKGKDAKE